MPPRRRSLEDVLRIAEDVLRANRFVADKTTTGDFDAMPLWAGESVGGAKRLQSAREIVRELADEAEALLRPWGSEVLRKQIGLFEPF